MAKLHDILQGIEVIQRQGADDIPVHALQFDSRRIEKNDLFFAVTGTQIDGHRFIGQAIEQGAGAIICQRIPTELPETKCVETTFILVKNVSIALGIAASNFHGNPSRKLRLLGITGTNGKTTTVTSLFRLFTKLGHKAGLLSTIGNQIGDHTIAASHTTTDALQINRLLRQMVEEGCEYCFMEASSHALSQHRTAGLMFSGGIFSNLTQDHLDYHVTFEQYLQAKKSFFDSLPENAFALINADDHNAEFMVQDCQARKYYYGTRPPQDFTVRVLGSHFDGMDLDMDGSKIHTELIGRFNASNLLAVYASAILFGQSKDRVFTALEGLGNVPGRFESVHSKSVQPRSRETDQDITAIIDYAHTPDALKNVLETIHHIKDHNQRVITVVGTGGNRDRAKRPLMARIADTLSHKVVLTSDNPRWEEPFQILHDMQQGIDSQEEEKVITIPERREAIRTALQLADPGDIVLVAGKGHETYQEIKGVRNYFDDKEVIMEFFRE